MKRRKQFFSILLAACMLLGMFSGPVHAAEPSGVCGFADVAPDAWYGDAVEFVYERGLMVGTTADSFAPDGIMDRGMVVTILWRQEGSPAGVEGPAFSDVGADAYYAGAVAWASGGGIVNGFGDGRFGPEQPVTREQLAVMLYRYVGAPAVTETSLEGFADAGRVGSYAADAMAWAVDEGLITGTGGGLLDPQGQATRAQAAAIFMRLLTGLEDSGPGTYGITGLTVENGAASVIVTADRACTLRLRLIDEADPDNAPEFTAPVAAGLLSQEVAVELDGTVPERYTVECDLLDSAGEALCGTYTCLRYTSAYEEFEAKTPESAEFQDDIVIPVESAGEGDGGFAVLAQGTQEIAVSGTENTLASVEENVYTFRNADEGAFSGLETGDVLYLPGAPEEQALLKVDSVALEGDTAVITAREDCTLSDFYQYLNIDASVPVTAGQTAQSRIVGTGWPAVGAARDNPDLDWDVEPGLELSATPIEWGPVKISGKGTGSVRFRLVYDLVAFGEDYLEFETAISTSLESSVSITKSVSDKDLAEALDMKELAIPLYKGTVMTGVPGLNLSAEIKIPFKFELEGGLEGSAKMENTIGVLYTSIGGLQPMREYSSTASMELQGKGQISLAVRGELGVKFLGDILEAEAGAEAGVKGTGTAKLGGSVTAGAPSYHACASCVETSVDAFLNGDIGLSYKITEDMKGTLAKVKLPMVSEHLLKGYISLLNDPDSIFGGKVHAGTGECPNQKYLVTFAAKGSDGKTVTGAAVSVRRGSGAPTQVGSTPCSDYFYPGSYTASADIEGAAVEQSFAVDKAALSVSLTAAGALLEGTVTNSETKEPVSGATVESWLDGELAASAVSGGDGAYTLALPAAGEYTVRYSAGGYADQEYQISLAAGTTSLRNVALQPASGSLTVTVTAGDTSAPAAGAAVEAVPADGSGDFSGVADSSGRYTFPALPAGEYELRVTWGEYPAYSASLTVQAGDQLTRTVSLRDGQLCGPSLYWQMENGTLTIYGQGEMYDYNGMYNSPPWYDSRRDITRIVIEPGATTIGSGAFKFTNVASVSLPDTLETIGSAAFYDCRDLTSISIPGSVKSIGNQAFLDCWYLETVTLSDGLVTIGDSVFNNCRALTGITIPSSVETIGANAFYDCWDLEHAELSYGLVSIGNSAFENCSSLKAIHIPDSVTSVGRLAFKSCPSLAEATLSSQLTVIPYSMFHNDHELTSITLPAGLTEIDGRAFSSAGLTSLVIPDGVTRIGEEAFYNCNLTSVHIPSQLEELGSQAFYNNEELTGELVLPAGVRTIGKMAFSDTSLSSVRMEGAVASIGYKAFFPDTLTNIYYGGTQAQFNTAMGRGDDTDQYLGLLGKTVHCTDGTLSFPEA